MRPDGPAAGSLRGVEFVEGNGTVRYTHDDVYDPADRDAIYAFQGGGVGLASHLNFDLIQVDELWVGMLLWPAAHVDAVAAAWARAT